MKYIITEARLNDIIEKYLSSELGNLKLVEKKDYLDWYVNESGYPLVIINRGAFRDILALRRDIYETLKNMFGLDTTDDIQDNLRKYFYTKWGLSLDVVYTYGQGNEDMMD
jgi:hypothetical protein